jgi:hypothetical protein
MTRHRIDCIIKQDRYNPHERILEIGGRNPDGTRWRISQQRAVQGVLNKEWSFFVHVGSAEADVIVAYHLGNPYLKTKADTTTKDNLLSLVSCPAA